MAEKRTGIWGYVDAAKEAYDKYKDLANKLCAETVNKFYLNSNLY